MFDKETRTMWIVLALASYFAIASVVFALRHPRLTSTERMLNMHNALLFRKVEDADSL